MQVKEMYSHLNGYEWLLVHKPHIWKEIVGVIESIDAESFRTKKSKEKTMHGKMLYSPIDLIKSSNIDLNGLVGKKKEPVIT